MQEAVSVVQLKPVFTQKSTLLNDIFTFIFWLQFIVFHGLVQQHPVALRPT